MLKSSTSVCLLDAMRDVVKTPVDGVKTATTLPESSRSHSLALSTNQSEIPPAASDKVMACGAEENQDDEIVESSSPMKPVHRDDILSPSAVFSVPVSSASKSLFSTAVSSLASLSRRILGYSDITTEKPNIEKSMSHAQAAINGKSTNRFVDMTDHSMFSEDTDRQLDPLNVRKLNTS